jgi:hypothetical protein
MSRSAEAERRIGVIWLVAGTIFLACMLGMWRLVSVTNSQGDHDAYLLPFFALIPLGIGAYHVLRSRPHHA